MAETKKEHVARILSETEDHMGLTGPEIADVIASAAERGAKIRTGLRQNDGGSDLTVDEIDDLERLLGRPSRGCERLWLGQCIQVLISEPIV